MQIQLDAWYASLKSNPSGVRSLADLIAFNDAGGEERERKQFLGAVKDGYVLCQRVFHSVLTFIVVSTQWVYLS